MDFDFVCVGKINFYRDNFIKNDEDMNTPRFAGFVKWYDTIVAEKEKIAAFLIENNADINAKNFDEETPLHLALTYRHQEVAEFLIKNGADLEAKDTWERTPMHKAASSNESMLHNIHFILSMSTHMLVFPSSIWCAYS